MTPKEQNIAIAKACGFCKTYIEKHEDDIESFMWIPDYCGESKGDVDQKIYDRIDEINTILHPSMVLDEPLENFECGCGHEDCWECVYKDDPMGI